jgi:hypothetical protein
MGGHQRTSPVGSRFTPLSPTDGYAYGNEVRNSDGRLVGHEGGFGIASGIGNENGWNYQQQLLQGNGFTGARSEDDGSAWYGIGGHLRAAGLQGGYGKPGNGGYGQLTADAFGADAEASLNPDRGAQVGAGAYIVQGAVEGGYNNRDTQHGVSGRIGAGAGVGAAGRLHWADEDGDGVREVGLGADIGPVSFDVKSETLGQVVNWVGSWFD